MMETIEFQVSVKNGVIEVPPEFEQELAQVDSVKITITKNAKRISSTGMIAQLRQNPVKVDGFLTREEMHNRGV